MLLFDVYDSCRPLLFFSILGLPLGKYSVVDVSTDVVLIILQVGHDVDHFTNPEGVPGVPETNFNNRPNSFKVLSPARTCVVSSTVGFIILICNSHYTKLKDCMPTCYLQNVFWSLFLDCCSF